MNEQQPTNPALGRGDRILLYGTVATTGAAVMMLELLGTRIIGPFYGVSLYVWSSLISVALIALSLGYYLGGVVADRDGLSPVLRDCPSGFERGRDSLYQPPGHVVDQ